MQILLFEITEAKVGAWSTDITIKSHSHSNPHNAMSPEAFFHHLGSKCGRALADLRGLTFVVVLPDEVGDIRLDDPLSLCGQTISTKERKE